ncbi:nitrilase-related carbon-nitrogen hydrolase [Pseudomonas aeruginosa]
MTLIAAAQSCAHPADLPRSLDDHLRLMRIAQARGVRLLVFPELSLTGYEPTAAARPRPAGGHAPAATAAPARRAGTDDHGGRPAAALAGACRRCRPA